MSEELHLVACPEPTCTSVAEVIDEWTQASTDGPVRARATVCLERHRLYALVEPASGHPTKE